MLPVLDTQLGANPPYGASKIACHLVRGIRQISIVAEDYAQTLKLLHILKRGAIVAKHQWVAGKEGHGLGLVCIQRHTGVWNLSPVGAGGDRQYY